MHFYKTLILIFFGLICFVLVADSAAQRNPVLEYCTGTWCGFCPCGHDVIENNIIPNIPNAIVIGYHGSDPMANFQGNNIIGLLGLSSYPTGIVDRVAGPLSRSAWYNQLNTRNNTAAKVDILITKTFNENTGALLVEFTVVPLVNISGNYKLSLILLEDGLVYSQACYAACCGSDMTLQGYVHDHVTRGLLNGALGSELGNSSPWFSGTPATLNLAYTIPTSVDYDNCSIVAIVYKENNPLNRGEIQQAMKWDLIGDITPVEFTSFAFYSDAKGVNLVWSTATETNNRGFYVERSINGQEYAEIGFVKGAGTTSEKQNYFYRDENPSPNSGEIYYRLKQVDYDGSYEYSQVLKVNFETPAGYSLSQNFPNPFNPSTMISFSVTKDCPVKLFVYDVMGRRVASLMDEFKEAGRYDVNFDAAELASGTYFYSLITPEFSSTKKMIVIK